MIGYYGNISYFWFMLKPSSKIMVNVSEQQAYFYSALIVIP